MIEHRAPMYAWGQPVRATVDLFVPLALSTPTQDRLDEVVDYDFIRQTISERVARGHIELQETLCDDLMALDRAGGLQPLLQGP